MAESSDDPKEGAAQRAPEAAAAGGAPQPPPVHVRIDDSNITALYANFCRITGTPEEMIIDFGLSPQPFGIPAGPIPVTQRVITNFFTAKRMLAALQMAVQRHEAVFGALETDVQRRMARPSA